MLRRCRSIPRHARQQPCRYILPWTARLLSSRTTTRDGSRRESSGTAASSPQKGVPQPKLIYPDAPSSHHADLASFLSYARRTGLDETSTVYIGTHYEYSAAAALRRYGFYLRRIGGASDHGVDLVGTWTLPSRPPQQLQQQPRSQKRQQQQPPPMRVLIQCKAGSGHKVSPQHVRELEGAFVGAPAGWRGGGVLGVLATERPATKGVRDALGRSRWPLAYMCCSREGGVVSQMLWNRAAEELGLEGYAVVPRRGGGGEESALVLMHNGAVVGDVSEEK